MVPLKTDANHHLGGYLDILYPLQQGTSLSMEGAGSISGGTPSALEELGTVSHASRSTSQQAPLLQEMHLADHLFRIPLT